MSYIIRKRNLAGNEDDNDDADESGPRVTPDSSQEDAVVQRRPPSPLPKVSTVRVNREQSLRRMRESIARENEEKRRAEELAHEQQNEALRQIVERNRELKERARLATEENLRRGAQEHEQAIERMKTKPRFQFRTSITPPPQEPVSVYGFTTTSTTTSTTKTPGLSSDLSTKKKPREKTEFDFLLGSDDDEVDEMNRLRVPKYRPKQPSQEQPPQTSFVPTLQLTTREKRKIFKRRNPGVEPTEENLRDIVATSKEEDYIREDRYERDERAQRGATPTSSVEEEEKAEEFDEMGRTERERLEQLEMDRWQKQPRAPSPSPGVTKRKRTSSSGSAREQRLRSKQEGSPQTQRPTAETFNKLAARLTRKSARAEKYAIVTSQLTEFAELIRTEIVLPQTEEAPSQSQRVYEPTQSLLAVAVAESKQRQQTSTATHGTLEVEDAVFEESQQRVPYPLTVPTFTLAQQSAKRELHYESQTLPVRIVSLAYREPQLSNQENLLLHVPILTLEFEFLREQSVRKRWPIAVTRGQQLILKPQQVRVGDRFKVESRLARLDEAAPFEPDFLSDFGDRASVAEIESLVVAFFYVGAGSNFANYRRQRTLHADRDEEEDAAVAEESSADDDDDEEDAEQQSTRLANIMIAFPSN